MAAITAAVVAGAVVGTTGVMAANKKKKGAEEAGKAFKNVGRGIQKVDRLESGIRQLMGVAKEDENTDKDTYAVLRDRSNEIVQDQMEGNLSEATRVLLGRNALATGATGLGRGAVNQAYTGYLGLATESQVNMGFQNYRAMFGQLGSAAQQQQAMNYNMQYNAAAQKANVAMMRADADAQAISAIGQGVSMAVGGLGGIGGGAGAGAGGAGGMGSWGSLLTMAGGNQSTGPSTVPANYQPRNVSDRPPGI